MKNGIRTSEFWVTFLTAIATIVISIAALFGHNLDGSDLQPLISLGGVLAASATSAAYAHSRASVKSAATPNTESVSETVSETVHDTAIAQTSSPIDLTTRSSNVVQPGKISE